MMLKINSFVTKFSATWR